MLSSDLQKNISKIPDFPKKGVLFRDVQPLLMNASLCKKIIEEFCGFFRGKIDVVCGIESRGFLFGPSLAQALEIPFVMIRKKGKLPHPVFSQSYDLEYGTATLQISSNAVKPFSRAMVHDDVLATGGTAEAAAILLNKMNISNLCFGFLAEIPFLEGRCKLTKYSENIRSLVHL